MFFSSPSTNQLHVRSSGVGSSWVWEELDLNGKQLAIHQKQVRGGIPHSFVTDVLLAEIALETDGWMEFESFLLAKVRHNAACLSVS